MCTNFYLHSFKLYFFSSLIITTTFCLIYFPINYKLNKNKINTDNQNKNKDNFKTQILFCKSHEIMSLISQLLDYKNYTVISSTHFITQDNDIYLLYKTPLVSQKDLYDVYKSCTQNNITIFCFECENNTISPENYNLNFITLDKLFTLATKKNKTTFSNYKIKKSSKYSLYSLLCIVLSKNKANQYFKGY